jgi:1,4-dihydroxy-2-naphthoyl-CoA synthase
MKALSKTSQNCVTASTEQAGVVAEQTVIGDVLYEASGGVATTTINRPEALNASRGRTCQDLTDETRLASAGDEVGFGRWLKGSK